uniref:Mitochondrial carrier protein n=1 Tax=Calcidiscus leptoporus TaxID=127549 RepID=A0A7S0ISV8_9EUKA|mmetsp:Transcript_19971/g.46069  ORF Transcript_19971/g.46069 Transcript_19971/m.46069 type:complete len:255 (+) Transcript_19971:40-804(+)
MLSKAENCMCRHPLDCVKVKMQATPGGSMLGCAARLLRDGGPLAFTRGLGAPLSNAVLMNVLMFTAFAEANRSCGPLVSGALSGLLTSALSTPFDYVKIQLQLRGGLASTVLRDVLRQGPLALYVGHSMNMLRESVFTGVYLGAYAHVRAATLPSDGGSPSLMVVAAASASTGALAWIASYPFDAVKSVQQGKPVGKLATTTIASAFHEIHQRGGWGSFYRGVTASTCRAVLVTCSRLVAYEFVMQQLQVMRSP